MAAIRRNNNFSAKLVLLGNSGTGKTSLVLRFIKDQFIEFQIATVGAAFWSQKVVVSEDTTVKFEIWDTAGQERYYSMAPLYCRGAAAAVIVYDITNTVSFLRAKTLVQELKGEGEDGPVMALVGNKVDLEANRRVNAEEAHLYAEENGVFFLETSAKYATNVNEIFSELAQRLFRAQPPPISNGIVNFEPVDPPILLQATRWWTCFIL